MTLTLDWVVVQLAFVVATAFLGFMIGWKYMAIWTIGVFFSTLVADRLGPVLETLINRFLSVIAEFAAIGAGSDAEVNAPQFDISEQWQPVLVAVFFLFLVLFSGWIANKLGNQIEVGLLGKVMGAVFGALGTVLVLSQLSNYWTQFVAASDNDPFGGDIVLGLPSVTVDLSGSSSGMSGWANLGGLAIAAFLALLVIYTIWRVVRKVI